MNQFILYSHGGSANHGCEALARTISTHLGAEQCTLLSDAPEEDQTYQIDSQMGVLPAISTVQKLSFRFIRAFLQLKVRHDYIPMDVLPYFAATKTLSKDSIGVSIGGDVYCYDDYKKYILLHRMMKKRLSKTILLGCSIEPSRLTDPLMLEDLRQYDLITARESITFHAMRSTGLTNVVLCPDSAFTLKRIDLPIPDAFLPDDTVGINISPLVDRKSPDVFQNYNHLIQYILEDTNYTVALISHVVWSSNDDREPLSRLYSAFSASNRIIMIDDCNAMQLKGFIARCRFFVGARTHATIAAYSSCVPTLAVGYSVKSKGIATDLFGTDENYVVPIENMQNANALAQAFEWLVANETHVKNILQQMMPQYIRQAENISNVIHNFLLK